MTSGGRTVAVFLNYRTPHDTIRAVQSLRSSSPSVAAVVVDNASGDGSAELLRSSLPDVRLVIADRNSGFSAGCNIGIRLALESGAARVLLLNSDALVPAGMVEALHTALDRDPRIGIAGPIVVDMDDPDRVQSAGIRYDARSGRMRHHGFAVRRSKVKFAASRDVDGISGCAMLVARQVFDAVGLFAEEYFFGFEDLDLCLRAHARGFRTVCIGSATVLHEGSLSIGRQSARRVYLATRNHLLLAHRIGGSRSPLSRAFTTSSIVALNLAYVLTAPDVSRREGIVAFVRGMRDYASGRYGAGDVETPPGAAPPR